MKVIYWQNHCYLHKWTQKMKRYWWQDRHVIVEIHAQCVSNLKTIVHQEDHKHNFATSTFNELHHSLPQAYASPLFFFFFCHTLHKPSQKSARNLGNQKQCDPFTRTHTHKWDRNVDHCRDIPWKMLLCEHGWGGHQYSFVPHSTDETSKTVLVCRFERKFGQLKRPFIHNR